MAVSGGRCLLTSRLPMAAALAGISLRSTANGISQSHMRAQLLSKLPCVRIPLSVGCRTCAAPDLRKQSRYSSRFLHWSWRMTVSETTGRGSTYKNTGQRILSTLHIRLKLSNGSLFEATNIFQHGFQRRYFIYWCSKGRRLTEPIIGGQARNSFLPPLCAVPPDVGCTSMYSAAMQ